MKRYIYLASLFWLILFLSPAFSQGTFTADAKIKVSSTIAANNTTAITIKTSGGTVYSVDAFNNGGTIAYVKLYNASAAPTCGSGTPFARYMIPFGASSSGGGFNVSNINGDSYGLGIYMCITTGIADNDASAPAASTYIVNVHYK